MSIDEKTKNIIIEGIQSQILMLEFKPIILKKVKNNYSI